MLRLKMAKNRKGKIVLFNAMKATKASSGTAPFIHHLGANRKHGGPRAAVDILESRKIS
jgi:hypothetical protein